MLGNRKKAAPEQRRGESASVQGWRTDEKKERKRLVWGWEGALGGWDPALGMLMRQGTFCVFGSCE